MVLNHCGSLKCTFLGIYNIPTLGILILSLGGSIATVVLKIPSVNSVVQKESRTNVLRVEWKREICQENRNVIVGGVNGKKEGVDSQKIREWRALRGSRFSSGFAI